MFHVEKDRLVRRRSDKMLALNGAGWPHQASQSHAQHVDYAKRTLYAYMPRQGIYGTEYIDAAVSKYFHNDWAHALHKFVTDVSDQVLKAKHERKL